MTTSPPSGRPLRLVLLGLLYVTQALPLGFFVVALPAILRSRGASLEQVGALGILALPFLLKFLWAPLVDRFGASSGHYRSWLLWLQTAAIVTVLGIAGFDPLLDSAALLGLGALFMVLAATQDVATDGLAVRLLWHEDRALGNGIQVGGYYLGQILGGGGVLVLVDRFGWSAALAVLAAWLALPLPLVARLREPASLAPGARGAIGPRALAAFFRRPGIGAWVLVLISWRLAETMVQWMVNPLLVDRGFSLEHIGLLLGVLGSVGALTGALLGGRVVRVWGRHRSLVTTGALLVPALAAYLLPALGIGGVGTLAAVVVVSSLVGGAATAALYTAAMDAAADDTAGTDFTIQHSLAAVGPMAAAGLSGVSAAALGYAGHFALAAGLQLVIVLGVVSSLALRRGLGERERTRELPVAELAVS
ncbi:MAG: MFS transporter [Thermoanaerobaculia bacterium]|nr:MFS transporter [Thermoanaerobaculia bacterium]